MYAVIRSSLSVGAAAAVLGGSMLAPAPPAPPPTVAEIRLMADPVPIGGLLTSFVGNQLIYCSIICPDIIRLAVTVPVGAALSPAAALAGLASGNVFKALGAAVASVTNPLDAAFDPIITNDLNLVLPRAQNALEVGVVGLLQAVEAGPAGVVDALVAARQRTFDALNDTVPPSMTAPHPHGLLQVAAVEAINVASAIAFQAFEEGLLGIVQTADAAATTLAKTGDPIQAFVAGEAAAVASLHKTVGYVTVAVHTAVTNITAALVDPPSTMVVPTAGAPDPSSATEVPAAVRRSLAADPGAASGDDGPVHRKADDKGDGKTDTAKSDTVTADDGPDTARPDVSKAATAKTDTAKPDTVKPDVSKADTVKSKNEHPKNGHAKSAHRDHAARAPHPVPDPTAKKASG